MSESATPACRVVVARMASRSAPLAESRERAVRDVAADPADVIARAGSALDGYVPESKVPVADGGDVVVVECITVSDRTRRRWSVRFGTGADEAFRHIAGVVGNLPEADTKVPEGFGLDQPVQRPSPPPPPRQAESPRVLLRGPPPAPRSPPARPAPPPPEPGGPAEPLPPDDRPAPSPGTFRLSVRRRVTPAAMEDFARATVDVADLDEMRPMLRAAAEFRQSREMSPAADGANAVVVDWTGPNTVFHRVYARDLPWGAEDLYWRLCDVLGRIPEAVPPEPAPEGVPGPPPDAAPEKPVRMQRRRRTARPASR